VRGGASYIHSDANSDETTASPNNLVTAFGSDGFTLGDISNANANTETFVAWCWKAGTGGAPSADNTESAGSSQTAGSVKIDGANGSSANGSIAVTRASANTTAGFSIITYTGTGSNGTVPHFLGVAPEFICVKKRGDGDDSTNRHWGVYHVSQGNTKYALLSDTNAFGTSSGYWNDTTPGTSTFAVGTDDSVNGNNAPCVAYCWASVDGFSRFGSYTGNNDSDGSFVYLGFKPAWLMIKRIEAGYAWHIQNAAMAPYNPAGGGLNANDAGTESTTGYVDFTSNGFKLQTTNGGYNGSATYIYAAFAESPFALNNRAR
jgi:hypothetical protein